MISGTLATRLYSNAKVCLCWALHSIHYQRCYSSTYIAGFACQVILYGARHPSTPICLAHISWFQKSRAFQRPVALASRDFPTTRRWVSRPNASHTPHLQAVMIPVFNSTLKRRNVGSSRKMTNAHRDASPARFEVHRIGRGWLLRRLSGGKYSLLCDASCRILISYSCSSFHHPPSHPSI